jgi:hypothetical protein
MILSMVPSSFVGTGDLERDLMIAASKAQARRRWVLRTSLMLVFSAAVLAGLIVERRDRWMIQEVTRAMTPAVTALQASTNDLGQLPASVPDVPLRIRLAYASNLAREYARATGGPVIIANTPVRDLVFRRDGKGVIIYENGKIHAQWISAVDFLGQWKRQEALIRAWDEGRRLTPPVLP